MTFVGNYVGKRTFDIVFSTASILILLPVIIAVALGIIITDGRPIIFLQQRVGRNGKPFKLKKFRSLPVSTAELASDELDAVKISRMGKFLRRTNLDELPQLFNVLSGNMSIVGPRPAMLSQTDLTRYRSSNQSLKCRPGLTGWAQINSFDYMTAEQKAELDAEYVVKISLATDIVIILRTFAYLTKPPPVY